MDRPETLPGGRIRLLDDATANQIAAGEVVERPASVVKELVENALDARATRIRVEVEEGGTRRIRITDDGHGMSRIDAELCLERHATSKIRSAEDLETVTTLGFRGEAVPSIASVSRFSVTTRAEGEALGTRINVEGGHIVDVAEVGAPTGTTIDVADLFFNVPARKKFLKRAQTELSHISEGLVRLAMCRPQVGFRLRTEHKTLLDVPPGVEADPKARLARILGAKVANGLHPVVDDGRSSPVRVTGFVAEPGVSERGTKGLYTFVNGRFVRDRTIQHAIQDGYRTLLERGRYPVVVLFLDLDPSTFDVNVHPQKTEIRFARTGDVHRAVTGALSRTLAAQPWLRGAPPRASQAAPEAVSEVAGRTEHLQRVARAHGRPYVPSSPPATASPRREGYAAYLPQRDLSGAYGAQPARDPAPARTYVLKPPPGPPPGEDAPEPSSLEAAWSGRFSELEPVGQVLGTYLVCQGAGRMVIVDQHAAHERVTFQRLKDQRRDARIAVQPLLMPLELELDPRRAALAHDVAPALAEIGFELEARDDGWWLKSCPALLSGAQLVPLVRDLLDDVAERASASSMEDRVQAMLSCAACHGSVRAQDRLTNEEIRALLKQMDSVDFGAFCPHGRPVFVEWTERELARLFHRS